MDRPFSIPEDEPEEVGAGRMVRLRRLALVEFPPELIGAEAQVVKFDPTEDPPKYTLELKTETPPYHNRRIEVRRHSFTTDL